MLKIFSLFNAQKLKENLWIVVNRFPVSVIMIALFTSLLFYSLHFEPTWDAQEIITKICMSSIIVFFFSIAVRFTCESFSINKAKTSLTQIIPILYWVLFYFWTSGNFFDNSNNFIFFILSLFWIIAYLFFSPYLKNIFSREYNQENYYSYFYKISVIFLTTSILAWLMSLLWYIAIWAVFALFDIRWNNIEKLYWDWAIISMAFAAPIFALINLPRSDAFWVNNFNENKFFSFLVKYISIPFIYVYFIILYSYSAKVLLNFWSWPKWEVCWMVIGFSIFWYLAYIFSFVFEESNKFIKTFRRFFPFVVFPQLFMLFYAIYLRIAQYDITVNRYFVVVFWLWLVITTLYLIISRKKYLWFIPVFLAIFTIIISVWPWSVFNLPESRQLSRLENNLTKAKILQNWKIVPLKSYDEIDKKLSWEIYNWINYLCDLNNCRSIKKLFAEQYTKIEIEFNKKISEENIKYPNSVSDRSRKMYKWDIVRWITEEIKVKYYYDSDSKYIPEYVSLRLDYNYGIFPMDISWYSKIYNITSFSKNDSKNMVSLDHEKKQIIIKNNWVPVDTIDVTSIFEKLNNLYKKEWETIKDKNNLIFDLGKYKIIFEEISIKNPDFKDESKDNFYPINWYLLVK